MVNIQKLYNDILTFLGQKFYTKTETDNKLNGKSDDGHTHTYNSLTDKPSTFTPASHSHGNIANGGTLNSDTTSVNKVTVTDSSNKIKTISKLPFANLNITKEDITGLGVPGTDTNTTYSAGTGLTLTNTTFSLTDADNYVKTSTTSGYIKNDGTIGTPTNTTYGADRGISNVNGKFGHSNTAVTAVTTSALKKIKYDAYGHITGTDNVSASDLPSHTHNTGELSDTSAYSNIGSAANATQKTINNNINTKLGTKANSNDVYTKSQTLSSSEITQAIADGVSNVSLFEVVTSLPTSNIKGNKFYLIRNSESINENLYDIYIYVNSKWESIDSLEFDIDNYYLASQVDSLLDGKVDTDDSRLTDSRNPKSHSHGNITNTGAVGSTANKPLITTTNGVVTAGSFGTAANTFCQGNDSRLSDARTPTSHTHGNITNDGKIGSTANLPVMTGASGALTTGSFEATASNIKMNGTANVGTLNTFARADHIHPTDTSRASTATATQSANGLLSSSDKQKIDKSMSVGFATLAGTTSAFTASITGVTLTHGTLIAVYNAVGANAANATLNVNSLGAKPLYYNASAIPASRFPNKSTVLLMYNTAIVSTGCWQLIYSYDSNTTYSLTTLKDTNAHTNIGTVANTSQADINTAIDTSIGDKLNSSDFLETLNNAILDMHDA